MNGDTDTVFFLVFSDSHSKPQYNLGYGWSTYWGKRDGLQGGLGYTLMLVARNDIFNGWPFPRCFHSPPLRYDKRHPVCHVHSVAGRHQQRQRRVHIRQGRARLGHADCVNILIIGGGGREHALAWKVAQSPRVAKVFVAPGNAGTMREPELTTVSLTAIPELVAFARDEDVALTIVGPEAPLAAGIVDAFRAAGLRIFGPTQAAAQLESSKDFAKAFMARHGIPTAQYRTFTDAAAARATSTERGAPIVVKADGLAAGKGGRRRNDGR